MSFDAFLHNFVFVYGSKNDIAPLLYNFVFGCGGNAPSLWSLGVAGQYHANIVSTRVARPSNALLLNSFGFGYGSNNDNAPLLPNLLWA